MELSSCCIQKLRILIICWRTSSQIISRSNVFLDAVGFPLKLWFFLIKLCNLSQVLNGNFLGVRSGTTKPALPLQKRGLQCGWSESYSLTEMSGRQIGGSKIILSFFFLSYAFVHCLKIPYYSNSANVNFKAYFQSRCIIRY